MKTIKEIDIEIEKLNKQKAKILAKKPKDTIVINGIEYETKDHDFDKELKDIQIPEGWRLWTTSETLYLYENYEKEANLSVCWFYVKQPRKNTTNVAGFLADSGGALLSCLRDPSGTDASLGVRFCRKKIRGKK